MKLVTAEAFASYFAITGRAARLAFQSSAEGKTWRGHVLPVVQLLDQRGGAGGKVWGLNLDQCSPALREMLTPDGAPETLPSTPVEGRLKGRADDRHVAVARDKQRIIAPILKTKGGSAARAQAFREVAAQPAHEIGGKQRPLAERTLRDWVTAAETNVAELLPLARKDRGQRRVRITRRWQNECGLPDDVQAKIAERLEKVARGLLLKGRSDRSAGKLCSGELQKLTAEAGIRLPRAQIVELCAVPPTWVARFREMKAVHQYRQNHKLYSDKHEYHVKLGLTERPMEVLMGDVHHVDLTVAQALASDNAALRNAAFSAALAGERKMKAFLIAWMDGSSGYL